MNTCTVYVKASMIIIALMLYFSTVVYAEDFIDQERLADAIFKAENSIRFPYGIKSIDTHGDTVFARKICLNTINNNLARWQWAVQQEGYKGDYIGFLGDRYCPKAADRVGHAVWAKNVRSIYNKAITGLETPIKG